MLDALAEPTYQIVSAVDVGQSLYLSKHCDRYHESVPITVHALGRCPNPLQTVAWGAGRGILHYSITWALTRADAPTWVMATWQIVSIGSEVDTVSRNYRIGLRISF